MAPPWPIRRPDGKPATNDSAPRAAVPHFRNPDGSFRRTFTSYGTPTDFKKRPANDIKHFLSERLLRDARGTNDAVPATAAARVWTADSDAVAVKVRRGYHASASAGRQAG